jgi:NADH-quinone oxidoreductase subunit G
MTTIFIDHKSYEVNEKQNLLAACLSAGLDLPYFCWHPAMGSVGACRQCAVKQFKDENDRQGRLVMACMTPASEGTRVSIADPEAEAFRKSVIEWLMANHPHDCPVCDEGGECHLQDMTIMTGHAYRRYRFPKRTYTNQYLGPFIKHDMNRCIQCYRCVRFYRDYAGGRDFNVFSSHDTIYFGRVEDGILENEFSGNLVEVCPTGVFTDNTLFHHYARKWDLQSAQSLCPHCSVGCNITPGERYGTLRRVVNRFNSQVNGYFLCDRGRFGYDYVNDEARVRRPLLRNGVEDPARPAGPVEAVAYIAQLLGQARGVVGIGSPRASLEANTALRLLAGSDRFFLGIGESEHRLLETILTILRDGPVASASIKEAEDCDAVLVLGEDLLNRAPRLALALLQSIRQQPMERVDALHIPRWDDAAVRNIIQERRGPLFLADYRRTWLHDYATESYFAAPDDIARLGFAMAQMVDDLSPAVADLSTTGNAFASRVSLALMKARRPLIVAGTGAGSQSTIQAAANVAWALQAQGKDVRLNFMQSECNSLGLALMGGGSLKQAFRSVKNGEADTALVLENDLYRRASGRELDRLLSAMRQVIVLDTHGQRTTAKAHAVLPCATMPESDGTIVNHEGRAQRFFQVFVPEGDVAASWRWFREIARTLMATPGSDLRPTVRDLASWNNFDDAVAAASRTVPALSRITDTAPPSTLRMMGQKIPRQPERFSGRTAMLAHLTVHEPPPPSDVDTPLAFSMEGYRGNNAPSSLIPQFWEPGWNSNQALNKYQEEIGGPLREEWPGVRLIEPNASSNPTWFDGLPKAFEAKPDRWLLLPLAQLFGSEELSRRSPSIAERTPAPYLALHPLDAMTLGVQADRTIGLTIQGTTYDVVIHCDPVVTGGTAGLFEPLLHDGALPEWIDLRRAIRSERRAA